MLNKKHTLFNKSYIRFIKHWFLECFFINLLLFVIYQLAFYIPSWINLWGDYSPAHPINSNYFIPALPIDQLIPVVKEFIVFYATAFAFWLIGSFFIYGFLGRKIFYRFVLANIIFDLIMLLFFIIFPTGISPDFRPYINQSQANSNIFWKIWFLTINDKGWYPELPSGHWGASLLIMIPMRKAIFNKNTTITCKITSIGVQIFGVLVCLSTLFVKQHYILDGIVTVIILETLWLLIKYAKIPKILDKIMYLFNAKLKIIIDKNITVNRKEFICLWVLWFSITGASIFGYIWMGWIAIGGILCLAILFLWMLFGALYFIIRPKSFDINNQYTFN